MMGFMALLSDQSPVRQMALADTLGAVTMIAFDVFSTQQHFMILRASFSLCLTGAALGMRWLVLVVILFGTILSSIGGTSSHGLAAISVALHAAPSSPDEPHGHAHEDQGAEFVMLDQGLSADHPHHEMDHSHDKAHALSVAWRTAAPQPSSWLLSVRPWIEMVEASRLERPPMG
jgi:hypothetical protein